MKGLTAIFLKPLNPLDYFLGHRGHGSPDIRHRYVEGIIATPLKGTDLLQRSEIPVQRPATPLPFNFADAS